MYCSRELKGQVHDPHGATLLAGKQRSLHAGQTLSTSRLPQRATVVQHQVGARTLTKSAVRVPCAANSASTVPSLGGVCRENGRFHTPKGYNAVQAVRGEPSNRGKGMEP